MPLFWIRATLTKNFLIVWFLPAHYRITPRVVDVLVIVESEAVIRWHRDHARKTTYNAAPV
jgi:hypothetical protein